MLFRGDNMFTMSIILSSIVTLITLYCLKPVAFRAKLLDIPQGRKQHVGSVPLIGGIAVFTGLAMGTLVAFYSEPSIMAWLLCSLGIVLLGVADDAEDLSVTLRMAMQTLLTLAVCIGSNTKLENLGNLVGLGEVHIGWISYIFTVLVVLAVINAFNMIDGIDGLLGSMALVSLISLAILFGKNGNNNALQICLIFIAALVPYLLNNLMLPPFKQKIFMGDAGSMLVGFTVIWLLMTGSQPSTHTAFRPITALWLIALPLMDMVRVIFFRLSDGRSPFAAGRDHLHHILLGIGLNKHQVLFSLVALASILASIGVLSEFILNHEIWLFAGFLLTFFIYQTLVNQLARGDNKVFNQTVQKIVARYESN